MEDVVTKITGQPAKPPGLRPSDHFEVAVIVQDAPGPVRSLRDELSDLLDERRVLVVTSVDGHVFGQPGRKSCEAVHRLCLQIPRHMDDCAALLVPGRGFDSRSYPLIIEMLDGMTSGMRPLFQAVFDDV